MGNLGLQLGLGKEQWMAPLHPFIKDSVGEVKHFIDKVIHVDEEMGTLHLLVKKPDYSIASLPTIFLIRYTTHIYNYALL